MASVQIRKTTSLGQQVNLDRDAWGFNSELGYFFIENNYEDGSRKLQMMPVNDLEHCIQILLDPDEAEKLDARNAQPPS